MAEHVVLLLVAPLLLALATRPRPLQNRSSGPIDPVVRDLPAVLERFERWATWLVAMVGAFAVHTVAMVVWHLPGPFDAAVRHDPLHAVEHLSMLGAGYLFWAVLLAAPQLVAAVPALFVAAVPGTALGAALTLSTTPWYATAPSLSGQQVAGVVMWGFGGLVYVIAAAVMFGVWLASLESHVVAAG